MEITVPQGMEIEAVMVCTAIGIWSYPLKKAIEQGHIQPVNISTGRYEVVVKGAANAVKVVLIAHR